MCFGFIDCICYNVRESAHLRVALAIAAIFIARFAVGAWFDPGRNGDIAWQQWLGQQIIHTGHLPLVLGHEAFAAQGAPWVPQEWALSLLVALTVGTPQFPFMVLLTTLVGGATLVFTAWSAKRLGSSTIATALCTLCVAFSMVESYGIRAQVFAWALLAGVMFVLRTCEGRARWWIVPLTVAWANVHASAMLAPVVLALWTAGVALEQRMWNRRVKGYALLTGATAAAVFLTPLTYRLPLYAISLLHSPIRFGIQEWQPADLSATSFVLGPLPLILAAALLGVSKVRRWPEFLVFAALTWLAFTALRNSPICAVVLAPVVAQRLSAYLPQRLRINAIFSERPAIAMLYCATLSAAALSAFTLAHTPKFVTSTLPQTAIAQLAAVPGKHQLLCQDFAWCSSALAYPNLREFMDGRCDPFPLPVWSDFETVSKATRGWQAVLDRREVDAILAKNSSELGRALPHLRQWRRIYADKTYRLYVRRGRAIAVN